MLHASVRFINPEGFGGWVAKVFLCPVLEVVDIGYDAFRGGEHLVNGLLCGHYLRPGGAGRGRMGGALKLDMVIVSPHHPSRRKVNGKRDGLWEGGVAPLDRPLDCPQHL